MMAFMESIPFVFQIVIPAKAGIQGNIEGFPWTPACAGVTIIIYREKILSAPRAERELLG
jgi:hypothetical protein